ncbi:metallophosphoesterase family protein [Pricia sp. S334]|uniref:Phosphoesterase n=1 Tax=Pricia mediterranea TaxID=3076079 RepID=A0ABU3L377_9FLAO|nr:metallophosphoesterase family protein [Pricia sp. S334]MDT7827708.1 metallophosphoesterase family protein [Pricia sp. S334]
MTKVLLLSDTHSHIDEKILKYARQADEIWHAGDIGSLDVTDTLRKIKPVRGVYGNIDDKDIQMEFPLNNRFRCEDVEVLMTHIGGYPPRYNARSKSLILTDPPKLFICGHSHILKVMWDRERGILHMNPGACGIHGFHKVRTMLRFVIERENIKDLEIIELGKRGGGDNL